MVALKLPRFPLVDRADRERFFREARAAAHLKHPNIVRLLEADEIEGQVYLANDFVDGVTLKQRLQSSRMSPYEAMNIARPIAAALAYAHEHGVVHRDIKPTNILLDSNGSPLLADFGLARRLAGEMTLTAENQVLGTPGYMSPEQAGGRSHEADHRSDIYSFGVLLFELLTGELPFRGETPVVVQKIADEDAPTPRQLNPTIPRDLDTIVQKCLERNPAARYQSAADVVDELDRYLAGKPIVARRIGPIDRGWRWCKRHRVVTTAALLLTASAIVSIILALTAQRESTRAQLAEVSAERRARDYQRLAYSVEGKYSLEKGLLREAFQKITAAMQIKPSWHYEHLLARVVAESRKDWALVGHFSFDQAAARAAFVPPSADQLVVEMADHRTLRLLNLSDSQQTSSVQTDAELSHWLPLSSGTVAVVDSDQRLQVLRLPQFTLAAEIQLTKPVISMASSPDAEKLGVVHADGEIAVYRAETLDFLAKKSFPLARNPLYRGAMQVTFSPSGEQAAVTNGEWTRRPFLWRPSSDELIELPSLQQHYVRFLDESRMLGVYTVSEASDMTDFHIYSAAAELKPGEPKTKYFPGNARGVAHVWLAEDRPPDESDEDSRFRAALFGEDAVSMVRGWTAADTSRIELGALLPHRDGPVSALDLTPSGPTFAVGIDNEIYIFRRRQSPSVGLASRVTMRTAFWSFALSDSSIMTPYQRVTTDDDGRLLLSDLNLTYPESLAGHPLAPWGMAVTPDENTLAILFQENSGGGTITADYFEKIIAVYERASQPSSGSTETRYRLRNQFLLPSFAGTNGRSNRGISITPDARTILFCSQYGRACIYDAATGRPHREFSVGNRTVHAPNGLYLAHGSYDDVAPVAIVDARSADQLAEVEIAGIVRTMAFDSKGRTLHVGWQRQPDDRLDVFELPSGKRLGTVDTGISPVAVHPRYDEYLAFRPQTETIGTSVLIEGSSGRLLEELDDGAHIVGARGFSGNGELVAIPDRDELIVYTGLSEPKANRLLDRCERSAAP